MRDEKGKSRSTTVHAYLVFCVNLNSVARISKNCEPDYPLIMPLKVENCVESCRYPCIEYVLFEFQHHAYCLLMMTVRFGRFYE